MTSTPRPHVVIVGAGFGGLAAAKALAHAQVDVTVIDRRNHHLFQPLLYQVATAGLSPAQIASPIRSVLRDQANTRVLLAEVTAIDAARRTIVAGGRELAFDTLILATGATHAYFGHDVWAAHAPGLKSLEDAIDVRRRILLALEAAETAEDEAARRRLLTFAVIGAGPTGVELAGAIAELVRRALRRDFRAIRAQRPQVLLIEAGPRVLPTFDAPLSAYAARALERLGVEVRTGSAVTDVAEDGVRLGATAFPAATVIWAAGVRASSLGAALGVERDSAGRVAVQPDLSVPGEPAVFVIGDLARLVDANGRAVPGVAPAAKQEGQYVAALIKADIAGADRAGPFAYADFGALATVGRQAAAVQIGTFHLTGFVAWVFWSLAHIYFLIGFKNRIQVTLDWVWSYLTFERGSRLITGPPA